MKRVDRASPLTIVLGVRLVLLSTKIGAGATLLDACRTGALAVARELRESW